jgi:hypothetical protein
MPTVEERLASLEARADAMADLRNLVTDLRSDMNRQFGDMNRQFADMNRQFAEVRTEANSHFLYLDQKTDRHFTWLVGTQLALLLAVIGALASGYFR